MILLLLKKVGCLDFFWSGFGRLHPQGIVYKTSQHLLFPVLPLKWLLNLKKQFSNFPVSGPLYTLKNIEDPEGHIDIFCI